MNEVDEKEKLFRELLVHPKIKNINGKGLCFVNLGTPEYTWNVAKKCMEKVLLFSGSCTEMNIRISPPLTFQRMKSEKDVRLFWIF
jgi:acetylornithine/succinyldiaminopimelate/putrescine aminotransferase